MYSDEELKISCVAPNCQMRSYNFSEEQQTLIEQDCSTIFCSFPTDPLKRRDWINALGDSAIKLDENSYLCDLHFNVPKSKSDFNSSGIPPTIFFSDFGAHMKNILKNFDTAPKSENSDKNFSANEELIPSIGNSSDPGIETKTSQQNEEIHEICISDDEFEMESETVEIIGKTSDNKDSLSDVDEKNQEVVISTDTNSENLHSSQELQQLDVPEHGILTNSCGKSSVSGNEINSDNSKNVPIVSKTVSSDNSSGGLSLNHLISPASFSRFVMTDPAPRQQVDNLLNIVKESTVGCNSRPSIFLISTVKKFVTNERPFVMRPQKVISVISDIVSSIKNLKYEIPAYMSIICSSPAIFVLKNVFILGNDAECNYVYAVTCENLISYLQAIHFNMTIQSKTKSIMFNKPVNNLISTFHVSDHHSKPDFSFNSAKLSVLSQNTMNSKSVTNSATNVFSLKSNYFDSFIPSSHSSKIPIASVNAYHRSPPSSNILSNSKDINASIEQPFKYLKPSLVKNPDGSGQNVLKLNLKDKTKIVPITSRANPNQTVFSKSQMNPAVHSNLIDSKPNSRKPDNLPARIVAVPTSVTKVVSSVQPVIAPSAVMSSKISSTPIISINCFRPVAPMPNLLFTSSSNKIFKSQSFTSGNKTSVVGSKLPNNRLQNSFNKSSKVIEIVSPQLPAIKPKEIPVITIPDSPRRESDDTLEPIAKKMHIEDEKDHEISVVKKSLNTAKFLQKQEFEIEAFETNILRKEREIISLRKQLRDLKEQLMSVKNPLDTKSDDQLVEEILSKYIDQDGVQFFVCQMKASGKNSIQYKWTDEEKLFSLGLLYKNQNVYENLFEKFTLPSTKVLSKFVSQIKKLEQEKETSSAFY